MAHIKKKIKFLATKLTSLQAELKVSREIMAQASGEVNEMFDKKYFPEIPVEPDVIPEETDMEGFKESGEKQSERKQENKNLEDKPNPSAKKKADPDVKRLFKKVAAMTHPDKLEGLSEYERKVKEELFKRAMTALENNDIISLADVAIDLEIETPELTSKKLKQTEKKINDIKRELNHIESTYVWKWFFCENTKEKDKILTTLFGIMYANGHRS